MGFRCALPQLFNHRTHRIRTFGQPVLAFLERTAEGAPEQAQLGQASIKLGQSGMQ